MAGMLENRIALVTGASRGIGRAVALGLAKEGAHIVALARTQSALESLDDEIKEITGKNATLLVQDLRKLDKLDLLGPALAERFGKLDIFIGNAGSLGTLTPLTHADPKMVQKTMDINVMANFRLLRTLDPLLRESDAGRVVVTSSTGAYKVRAYWSMYRMAKAALNMMVQVYAAECEGTAIKANIIQPGPVDTKMLAEAYPGGFDGEMRQAEDLVPAYLDLCSPSCEKNGEIIEL